MKEDVQKVLTEVLTEILEKFGFMFADQECEAAEQESDVSILMAEMTFAGPARGTLQLAAPAPLCRELASNVLGVSLPETGKPVAEDALKELLNIACGELVARLFGEKPVFDLAIPTVRGISKAQCRELSGTAGAVRLWVESRPVVAALDVENEVCDAAFNRG